MKKSIYLAAASVIGATMAFSAVAQAATEASSELSQQINAGVISTDIRDGSNNIVATPSFAMSPATVSTNMQTVTGTFGSSTQRISVDNPGGANGGWTLAVNATDAGTANWDSGTNTYRYNGTAAEGRLTLDPSIAALTSVVGASTGITPGTNAPFSGSTPITLLTAASGSDDVWNGYLTGVGVSQTIPAGTPTGTYTLDLTQTVTAVQ